MSFEKPAPVALKNWFDANRYRILAALLADACAKFEPRVFLAHALDGLAALSLMQRVRRAAEALHAALPVPYIDTLDVLRAVAPRIGHPFVSIFLCDFVALYGKNNYKESLAALRDLTADGSAEFAIRDFLEIDLERTLACMEQWAASADEHVRRLASEGSRPRLPWGRQVRRLKEDPALSAPILQQLMADPSLYVRKSVANHLNDHSRDHPQWVVAWLRRQDLANANTLWIARRALRSLVKKGHREALRLLGVGRTARLKEVTLTVSPRRVALGERITLVAEMVPEGMRSQKIEVDYAITYVRPRGISRKVFKWRSGALASAEVLRLEKTQRMQNLTTRRHHAGRHLVELLVNGRVVATTHFGLRMS